MKIYFNTFAKLSKIIEYTFYQGVEIYYQCDNTSTSRKIKILLSERYEHDIIDRKKNQLISPSANNNILQGN